MLRKIFGYFIISTPLIFSLTLMVIESGWKSTFIILSLGAGTMGIIIFGCWLAFGGLKIAETNRTTNKNTSD